MTPSHPFRAFLCRVLATLCLTTALYSQTAGEPPSVMHWCALHCTTLTWNNGHYGGPDSIWIVEKWTHDSIIIRRTDYRPYPGVAVLTGRISQKGDSIENGSIRWTYHPCCGLSTGTFIAAWGEAISTVPGSDEERAQMEQPQIKQSQSPPPAVGNSPPVDSSALCRSKAIRVAMQVVEDQEAKDPAGNLLGAVGCALTGVCGDAAQPSNVKTKILLSRPATDGAGYTTNDPGSFLCQGLFLRGDRGKLNLAVGENGDASSELTVDAMSKLVQMFPTFEENYKVRPLQKGQYELILIPGLGGLTQSYSTQFSYP